MIHVLVKAVQFFADATKPKIELVRIDLSNPEKDESINVNVQLCAIIEDGQGGYSVGTVLDNKSFVFTNPDYASWVNDDQLEDWTLSKLGFERK